MLSIAMEHVEFIYTSNLKIAHKYPFIHVQKADFLVLHYWQFHATYLYEMLAIIGLDLCIYLFIYFIYLCIYNKL